MSEKFTFDFEIDPPISAEEIHDKLIETLRLLNEEYGKIDDTTKLDDRRPTEQ